MDQLSPEAEARLRDYRPDWAMVSQFARDPNLGAQAIGRVYEAAGLPPPHRIVWLDGPVSMARDWLLSFDAESVGPNETQRLLRDPVQLTHRQLPLTISSSIRDAVFKALHVERSSATSAALTDVVLDQVSSIRIGLWRSLRRRLRKQQTVPSLLENGWSTFDAASFRLNAYRFCHDHCGFEAGARLKPLWDLPRYVGWLIPHRGVCWASSHPTTLATDDVGRLHGKSGPALKYDDGWSVYAWKGVLIPSWIIEQPESVNVLAIDRQPNPWIKRCMIEILTPEVFIARGGALCVSTDDTGKLWRRHWRGLGDDTWAAVEVINGTPEPDGSWRHYFLQVPPHVRTAREAVAWTYGMTERQYANLNLRT